MGPDRLGHCPPVFIGLESPIGQKAGLSLLCRDEADHALVQSRRNGLLLDVSDEAVLVLAFDQIFDLL